MKRLLQIIILSYSICLLAISASAEGNNNSLRLTESAKNALALNVTIDVGDATCAGASNGVVTAIPDGGLPPYTYIWNTGGTTQTLTNVPIGTYMVTVTDDIGATATTTAVVGESDPLNVVLAATYETAPGCSDGKVDVVKSQLGDTGPYTYVWSTGSTHFQITGLPAGIYCVTVTNAFGCTGSGCIELEILTTGTMLTTSSTNVSCNGGTDGTATVVAAGGVPPYFYQWDDPAMQVTSTAVNLGAGTYNVTVTGANNSCPVVGTVTITEPPAIVLTTSSTNISCNGESDGTATVVASGGAGSFSYQWDDPLMQNTSTAINLSAGTYNVTVMDGSNCFEVGTVTITEPGALDVIPTVTVENCNLANGTITLNVSGGTPNYSYVWSDPAIGNTGTATNLTAGNYSVTVSDANGCTVGGVVGPIVVTDDCVDPTDCTNPVVTSVVIFEATCGNSDGQVTVNVAGGPGGFSYAWTPNVSSTNIANNVPAGTYSVVITDLTDMTCTTTETLTVGVSDGPVVDILSTTPATCRENNGTAVLSPMNLQYEWCNGYIGNNPINLPAGECQVTVTDPTTNCVDVIEVVIEEFVPLNASPTVNQQPDCGAANGSVSITVGGGSFNYDYAWSDGGTGETRNDLAPGPYCVTVTDNGPTGCVTTTCFVLIANSGNVAVDATSPVAVTCPGSADGTVQFTVTPDDPANTVIITDANNVAQTNGSLIPGNYCITVYDNIGCAIGGDCFEVISPDQIDVDVNVLDKDCIDNGSINLVDVHGGNGGFTFAWSGPGGFSSATQNVSNLQEGSYSVTITDANGCDVVVDGIAVEDICNCAPPVVTSVVVIEAHCGLSDGKGTVHVAGNISDYNFIWTPNISFDNKIQGVPSGVYSVRIEDKTDATCAIIETFTVGATGGFDDVLVNQTDASCNAADGFVSLTPSTYQYVWNDNVTSDSRSDLPKGTYTVEITDPSDPNSCVDYLTIVVGEDNPLDIQVVVDQMPDCNASNGQVTLQVSGGTNDYTYSWGAATQNNLAGGVYTVNVTDNNTGCQKEITFGLSENVPAASLNVDPIVLTTCTGLDNATIDLTNLDTDPGFVGPAVITIVDASNTEFQSGDIPPGSYCAVIRDANNCIAGTNCFDVLYPDQIDVDIAIEDKDCLGDGSIELVEVIGGTGVYNFDWLDINPSTNDPRNRVDLDAGMYTVICSDENDCQVTEEIIVNENINAVTAGISIGEVSCDANMDGSITLTPIGGTLPYVFDWDPVLTNSPTQNNLDTGFYNVTITDGGGCTTVLGPIEVTVDNSLAILSATPTPISCEGLNDGAIDIVPTGGSGTYTYDWDPVLTNSGNQTGLNAGQYSVTVTDAVTGCTVVSMPIDLVASNSLNIQLTPDTTACDGTVELVVVVNSSSMADITWLDQIGGVITTDTTSIIVMVNDTLEYTVQVSAGGCMAEATVTVTEFILDPIITPTVTACMGDDTELNPNGDADLTYAWSPANGLDDPNSPNPEVLSPTQGQLYTVTITDPAMPNCSVERTVDLMVNALPPLDILGDRINCTLTEPNEFTGISSSGTQFDWATNDDFNNAVQGANYDGAPIMPGDSVTYYVRVIDPLTMCENIDSVELKNLSVQVELGDPVDVCVDDGFTVEPIISLLTGESLDFVWSGENTTIDITIPDEPIVAPSETTYVVAEITNNFGCSMQDSLLLKVEGVDPEIKAVADPDTILLGESSQLNVVGTGDYSYLWSPSATLSADDIQNPVATPDETTTYNVEIKTDLAECTIERSVEVVVVTACVENLFFPNAFTPNNDGVNDVLYLRGGFVKEAYFVIYNRWGEKVFESNNIDTGWDGTYKGKQLSSDVFGYYLKVTCIDEEEYYEQGNVSLLR